MREAIPVAKCAVLRSRETTTSWPSREPSFRVATFMPRLSVLFASRARRRGVLHWVALTTFGPQWFDPEGPPGPPQAMRVRSVALNLPAPPRGPAALPSDAKPPVAGNARAVARPAPRQAPASEPVTPMPLPAATVVLSPSSEPASASSGASATSRPTPEPPDASESAAAMVDVPVYLTRVAPAGQWRYRLQRGAAVGEAELSWQPQAAGAYEMRLQGRIAGVSVLDWVSRGAIDGAGIAPERYVIRRRGRDNQAANFQRDANKITFSGPTHELPLLPGVQDRLTWMLQLPAIVEAAPERFGAGARIVLMVVGARGGSDVWTFTVAGADRVGDTPALKLVREARRLRDVQVEVWLDPARGHLPLRAVPAQADGGAPLELRLDP